MSRIVLAGLVVLPAAFAILPIPDVCAAQSVADTVHVAPPTGETETDRASIQAAFDAVKSGGTVQFAPGTYLLGAGARLTVPEVTVLGHPEGTVLRGCDPEAFAVEFSEVEQVVFGCTGLYVETERQTIRGLTFEYAWHGIVVGPYPKTAGEAAAFLASGERPAASPAGGQRIEGNTFRATPNGLRVLGTGTERSVVRDNDFVDVFHAIGIYGAPLHFLDNRVTVAEPGGVPFSRHPGSAVIVSPGQTDCAGHVVAGNRIEGYPDPIYVLVGPGETCRGVEIRDNAIRAARVKVPEAWGGYTPTEEDSTMVGAPITLMNSPEPVPGMTEAETEGVLEEILVQGNRIVGAEGLGILVQGVSRSRIARNTLVGIQPRTPFPGLTWDGFEQRWEDANGSGIWLSPGSDDNEITGNIFEDLEGPAVFLEGDSNRVELRSTDDSVRDMGGGNRVIAPEPGAETVRDRKEPAHSESWTDPSPHEVGFLSVAPGVSLEVLDWGGRGEALVLLAGMQATAHTFDDFAPELAGQFRVLAVTRRGFGASSQPDGGYDLATLVKDVRIVLDTLGIERASLVGHSFGATEAVRFASLWPERVSRVVNIDGLMVVDGEAFMEAMAATPVQPPAGDADRASVAAYQDHIARIYGVPLPEAEIRARWSVLPDGSIGEPITPDRIMTAIFQHGISTPLDDVRVHLLALRAVSSSAATLIPYYDDLSAQGREQADRAFPALRRIMEAGWAPYLRMPTATVVDFQDANHHLYISRRDEIVEAVRVFLRGSPEQREAG